MKVVYKLGYKNKDGIAVGIVKNAPADAITKADVIAVAIVKKGKKLISETRYFTPDEAMGLAIGLMSAVDEVMDKKFQQFREEKDRKCHSAK